MAPDSFSSNEEVLEAARELFVETLVAVGKSLAKIEKKTDVTAMSSPIQKKSHQTPAFQKWPISPIAKPLSSTPGFSKGAHVWYKPSWGALCVCIIIDIFQEVHGFFVYTIQTTDEQQFDTIEPHLEALALPPQLDLVGFQAI